MDNIGVINKMKCEKHNMITDAITNCPYCELENHFMPEIAEIANMIEKKLGYTNGWRIADEKYKRLCLELAEEISNKEKVVRLNDIKEIFENATFESDPAGGKPLNVGKLKKIIADLDDDFIIEMRVRTRLTDEQLKNLIYPYPYNTEYTQLEFDDIGYSDKQLCLGCEIGNKHA